MDANKDGTIDMEEWEKFMTEELRPPSRASSTTRDSSQDSSPSLISPEYSTSLTPTSPATCHGTRSSTRWKCWASRRPSTSTPSSTPWTPTPTDPSPSKSSRTASPRKSSRPCPPNSTRRDSSRGSKWTPLCTPPSILYPPPRVPSSCTHAHTHTHTLFFFLQRNCHINNHVIVLLSLLRVSNDYC